MKKIYCIIAQVILLLWFFLDMTGVYFGNKCLVTRAYKDDGIYFVIYMVTIILFIIKEKLGKRLVIIWMLIWFVMQFFNHEWYTIFNGGFMGSLDGKIRYFSGTMKWLEIEGRYIPDIYHTILHILILLTLVCTTIYTVKDRSSNKASKCMSGQRDKH